MSWTIRFYTQVVFVIAAFGSGIICAGAAALVLFVQSMHWLKTGVWEQFPFGLVLYVFGIHDVPRTDLVGLQKIIDWIVWAPIVPSLLILGFITWYVLLHIGIWILQDEPGHQPHRR